MKWKSISVEDLHEVHGCIPSRAKILDVRTPDEYRDGHIPGALNINHDQVQLHVEELKKFDPLYIICRSGRRAQVAADTLARAGVRTMEVVDVGGMEDWQLFGFPTEQSST